MHVFSVERLINPPFLSRKPKKITHVHPKMVIGDSLRMKKFRVDHELG